MANSAIQRLNDSAAQQNAADGKAVALKAWRRLKYYLLIPKNWLQLTAHNSWGILNVLDIIWLRPMPGD